MSTSTYTPNPEAMASYRKALSMAENVASIPFQPYEGQMIAGFTPDQMAAFQQTRNIQGMSQPYINAGLGMLNQAVNYADPRLFNQQTLAQYQNPYQQQVVDATMANLKELQAQGDLQNRTRAATQGTFGGSGEFRGRAEVARQQAMANAQTLAGLQQQGYQQAVNQYNQQQQQAIATAQNAAYGLGQLGGQAQQAAIQGIQALLGTGAQQQQLAQSQLTGAYQQFQQQRAYPYQQAAFYSGIASGIAPNMGGTTNTIGFGSGQTQQQQPQGGGGGAGMLTSLLSFLPMLGGLSDERTKTNIEEVGTDRKTGLPLYSYDDISDIEAAERGDRPMPPKRVSIMAQDLEAIDPDSVMDFGGLKGIRPDRTPAASGGAQGAGGMGASNASDALGFGGLGQNAYSAPSAAVGSGASAAQGGNDAAGQNFGALGVPQAGAAVDPGMSQFLQNVFDPQTADRIARAKWVNQPQAEGQPQVQGDNYVIPPTLMNDGGESYPYHPAYGDPRADGGRINKAGGGGFGSFFDLVQQGGASGPYADAPGNYIGAAQQLGIGKIIPPAKDIAKGITEREAAQAASQAQKLPGPGSGGGGAGGGGGGGAKVPEMKMPKPGKGGKPTDAPFDPNAAHGTPGGSSAAPGGEMAPTVSGNEPVSHANQEAGQKGFNFAEHAAPIESTPVVDHMAAMPPVESMAPPPPPVNPEVPWLGIMGGFGGFADGGRVHKDGGGAAGGPGALGGEGFGFGSMPGDGGLTALGQGGGFGDVVLGGAKSPGALAGIPNLMAGQETLTGQNLMDKLTNQYWENDPGEQKTPVQQGMPAMPDAKHYTTPRTDLPGKLMSENFGKENQSEIPGAMAMMGGKGAAGLGLAMMINQQQRAANAGAEQAKLQKTRAEMLADPANFPVEGYFSKLDSTSLKNPKAGMQLNPRTGLYNLGYTGAYRGMPYKDGGRVAKADGGSIIDRIAAGIAAIESGGSKNPYGVVGAKSRKGDRPYGKYQIMGKNIPAWGKEAGFPNLTVEQFRANPAIQEAVARHQFEKILAKSGGNPLAVAGEWLGGPGWRRNKSADVLGTTVPEYQRRFARAFNNPNLVASSYEPVKRAVPYDPTNRSLAFKPKEISPVMMERPPVFTPAKARFVDQDPSAPPGSVRHSINPADPSGPLLGEETAAAPVKKGLFDRLSQAIVPSAHAGDRDVLPGDAPKHILSDSEVTAAVGRGERIIYDENRRPVGTTKIDSEAYQPSTSAPSMASASSAPEVGPYDFGQLTKEQYPKNRGNVPGSPVLPIMAAEPYSPSDASASGADTAAKPAQKYWGDYRDVEGNALGDLIDEMAGDVRKSDVAGTAKTPMGKFQGEGGLGALFDMEGTLPNQFARGGKVRQGYKVGGSPGLFDALSTLGGSVEMPSYEMPTMSFEGQEPYRVPEGNRINAQSLSMPRLEDHTQTPERYSWRLRDHLPRLEDYGLRMPELRMPELAAPRLAAPELRVPELRNPRMNNLPDALGMRREQGPPLPAAHRQMGPEMPAAAEAPSARESAPAPAEPRTSRRPDTVRHTAPRRAAPRGRSAPVEAGLYWGDWRDAEPFAGDVIGNAIDSLTGDIKSSRKRGNINSPMKPYRGGKGGGDLGDLLGFAGGGSVRHGYATAGVVDEDDPLGALAGGLGQLGESIGGLFDGLGGPQASASSQEAPEVAQERPQPAAQGHEYDGPRSAGPDFLTAWSRNPLSQALLAAGLGMMASDRVNPLQAIGEGGLRGLQVYQSAAELEREREKDEAEQQGAIDLQRRMAGAGAGAEGGGGEPGTLGAPSSTTKKEPAAEGEPSKVSSKSAEAEQHIRELMARQNEIANMVVPPSQLSAKNAYLKQIQDQIDNWRKYGAPSEEEKAVILAERQAKSEEARQNRMNSVAEHKQLIKEFAADSAAAAGGERALASLDEMLEAYKGYKPGAFNRAATEVSRWLPESIANTLNPDWKKDAATYQKLEKEAMINLFDQLKTVGGQIRVAEMENMKKTLADPNLEPDAVKSILAQAKATAQNAIQFERDRVRWVKENPGAGQNDYYEFKSKWLEEHPVHERKKKTEQEIYIKGEESKPKTESSGASSFTIDTIPDGYEIDRGGVKYRWNKDERKYKRAQ